MRASGLGMRVLLLKACWCGLWALAAAGQAYGQGVTFNEAPADQVRGRVLVAGHLNFSVEAPDDGWHWLIAGGTEGLRPKQAIYVCEQVETGRRFAVTVIEQVLGELEPKAMATGFTEGAKREGWEIESVSSEPSDVPRPGAVRASWRGHQPGGSPVTTYVYAATARIGYTLLYQGPEATEPADFQTFARSFRLLRDVPPRPRGEIIRSVTYYFLLTIGLALGFVVNLVARRRLVNPGLAGIVLVLAFLVFRLISVTRAGTMAGISPESMGRLWAESVFEPAWPITIGVAVFVLVRRKKARSRDPRMQPPSSSGEAEAARDGRGRRNPGEPRDPA